MNLVNSLFNEEDRNQILRIPLSLIWIEDELVWLPEECGTYTVKYVYKLLTQVEMSKTHQGERQIWKRLWNLKILGKVKHTLWRALTSCLPSKMALNKKGIHLNPYCPVCGLREETKLLLFLDYSFARQRWDRNGIGYVRGETESMKEWFELA